MPVAVLPIISGLAGLFGGAASQKTQTSGTQSQTSNSTNTQSGSTTPNFSPLQQQLINQFTSGESNLANSAQNLNGYEASGLQQIGSQAKAQNEQTSNQLASQGLSFSPAAATENTLNQENQLNQSQQFMNQIPLLQRQLQQQALTQLQGGFSAIPTGVNTSGTSNTTGSSNSSIQGTNIQSTPGGALAGGLAGVGGALAASPINWGTLFGGNSGGGNNNNSSYYNEGGLGPL